MLPPCFFPVLLPMMLVWLGFFKPQLLESTGWCGFLVPLGP